MPRPIENIDIPPQDNATAIYAGAVIKDAAYPDAAKSGLAFVHSPKAIKIFENYGFKAYDQAGK